MFPPSVHLQRRLPQMWYTLAIVAVFAAASTDAGWNVMSTILQDSHERTQEIDLAGELFRLFGYEQFNGKQEEVISQVLARTDTMAVMPTGAGKSLCYQLPSMLLPGVTLVISPLIALMKDQYDSLPGDVYERTTFVNSSLDASELAQRMSEIVAGKYKLVYAAPERLRQQPFVQALRYARISLLVVDEAHCVSTWGHDFRPDYLFIGKCLTVMGHPTLLALTATATPQMRAEIASQLGRKLKPVVASIFRPNLYYEVEELADKEQKMKRLLEICQTEKGPGVIYARSRETCEQLAALLRRSGVQAGHYHAGMEAEERTRAQENFMLDRVRVIVATIAFGMGIDKGNVRFIVHFSPPDSLEGYVQESGRAGRDGRRARCVLFITQGDKSNISRWKRQEQIKVEELRAIYKEVARQVPAGKTAFVNLEEVERGARATLGKEMGSTPVRVGLSLLERVGLLVRHPDAPRTVSIALTPEGTMEGDPEFGAMRRVAAISPQRARHNMATLASELGIDPTEMEVRLLDWAQRGWIIYRSEKRDPVIERLPAPKELSNLINSLLQQQDIAQQRQISQMLDYASADRCRHQMLAAHLGEKLDECELSCDHCSPPADRSVVRQTQVPDLPENPGRVIIECLASFPYSAGKPSLVRALRGSAASNIKGDRVKHFGALAAVAASAIERAIDELVESGYLQFYEEAGYKLLQVTPGGFDRVPTGTVTLKAKKQAKPKERSPFEEREQSRTQGPDRAFKLATQAAEDDRPPTPEEADLFERLRAWRRVVANRINLPPYVIFHDKTLWAIAKSNAQSQDDLLVLKGVGRNNLERYGADLLALIQGL